MSTGPQRRLLAAIKNNWVEAPIAIYCFRLVNRLLIWSNCFIVIVNMKWNRIIPYMTKKKIVWKSSNKIIHIESKVDTSLHWCYCSKGLILPSCFVTSRRLNLPKYTANWPFPQKCGGTKVANKTWIVLTLFVLDNFK